MDKIGRVAVCMRGELGVILRWKGGVYSGQNLLRDAKWTSTKPRVLDKESSDKLLYILEFKA